MAKPNRDNHPTSGGGGGGGGGKKNRDRQPPGYEDPDSLLLPDGTPPPTPYYDPGTGTVGAARYHDGAQNEPYKWDEGSVSNLQARLIAAGFLGKGAGWKRGVWESTAANAYADALRTANLYGMTVDELLDWFMSEGLSGGGGGGGGGLGRAPISDEDITALANQTAQGVLGRTLKPDEIANFIPAFRGIYDAGEITPKVGAENLIKKEIAPQGEADAYGIGNVMQTFQKMLGG